MKKLHKVNMDMRASCFLLLIIITICGIYYTLMRKNSPKPLPFGEEVKAEAQPEQKESLEQVGNIMVEVSGAVENPGVYSLSAGDTVETLMEAAGGFTEEADLDSMNLADHVFHMEEVVVGSADTKSQSKYSEDLVEMYYPPKREETPVAESQKININTASKEELERLPGIGPKLAESIIAYRNEHGDFAAIENIMDVPKIGEKTFASFSDFITVGAKEN